MPESATASAGEPAARGGTLDVRLAWVMLLRVVLISVLLGATVVLNYDSTEALLAPSPLFLLVLIAASYVLTIAYALWYRSGRARQWLARVQIGLDLVLWGCLVYATGGLVSGFTFLFDLWVVLAAVLLGGRAAYVTAGASAAILAGLGLSFEIGALSPLSDQVAPETALGEILYSGGVNLAGLFLVAALVNSLTSRLEHAGRGLERERERRADLAALHADIIRSLTVGLATTGREGEVLTMNPAGLAMLGLSAGEIEGTPLGRVLPEVGRVLEGQVAPETRGHGSALRGDGRRIPVEYTVAPLVGADGSRRGAIVVFSDLSEIKKLEAALERSRRLAALGELGASLAHEIRNPLGAVSGSFQILASRPQDNEEDRSLLEIISREIERMERLVNDMLDIARPREADLRPCDVAAIVTEVGRAFRLSQDAEGRILEVDARGPMTARADAAQIRQVTWNLLRNAAQATESGDRIVLRAREDGDRVVVEVEDDGVGISPEDAERIFEPFFSTRERGLGLGLALCQRIVQAHGGRIEVSPGSDGGTIFRVVLPRRIRDAVGETVD